MEKLEIKNQAVDLTGLAIGIIVLGIVVAIGANILIGIRDARLTDLSTTTTSNEAVTVSGSTYTLDNTWVKEFTYVNFTNGTTVPATAYTTSISTSDGVGTITNTSWLNSTLNVTYTTYNTTRADWALADDAATGLSEYGNWFDILVIVGVAGVILALLFLAFGRNSGEVGGQAY